MKYLGTFIKLLQIEYAYFLNDNINYKNNPTNNNIKSTWRNV